MSMDSRDEVLELLAEGHIEDAVLEHLDLTKTRLGPLEPVGVTLRDVDLSKASLQMDPRWTPTITRLG